MAKFNLAYYAEHAVHMIKYWSKKIPYFHNYICEIYNPLTGIIKAIYAWGCPHLRTAAGYAGQLSAGFPSLHLSEECRASFLIEKGGMFL